MALGCSTSTLPIFSSGSLWKPVVAELVAFLPDFLPVDHLHEHQVPGFSWPKNPGTKGLKGQ